jgi:general secretion pathway protein F/type IV pilus assembly protein PilC
MALYQYQALDNRGKKNHGIVEADNDREAKEKLRSQGLMISHLSINKGASKKENLKNEVLLTFTLQLSQLVNAGVPLYESLVAIEEQYRKESYHRVLISLCDRIKGGSKLSEAMSAYPESFDKLYCSMIAAGEAVGGLHIVLEKLTLLLNKKIKLKKEITTAMIYPAILASFSLLVIGVLLGFVVPSIEGIFADRELNGFTQFILSLSHLFRDYWWLYLPLFIGLGIFSTFKLRSPAGKLWLQKHSLKVPILKNLVIQASLARFCRTMGTLQQGGLTIIDSLRIAREVMKNATLEDEIKKAEEKIIEGSSLSVQLSRSVYIPAMVSRMLSIGEDSGNTVTMMNKIADMYEDELEKTLARAMALAQPIILIVMGGIIGLVMVAILLPLTDIASFSIS